MSTPCERRKAHNIALVDAIEYCNRKGFGEPKYYRAIYDNDVVVCLGIYPRDGKTVRDWFRNAKTEHIVSIVKEWSTTGWEECYNKEIGWY